MNPLYRPCGAIIRQVAALIPDERYLVLLRKKFAHQKTKQNIFSSGTSTATQWQTLPIVNTDYFLSLEVQIVQSYQKPDLLFSILQLRGEVGELAIAQRGILAAQPAPVNDEAGSYRRGFHTSSVAWEHLGITLHFYYCSLLMLTASVFIRSCPKNVRLYFGC